MTVAADVQNPLQQQRRLIGPAGLDRRDGLVFLLLLVGLCSVYVSVLSQQYAYLDDYFWLDMSVKHPAEMFADQAVQGRPLNGLILPHIFQHAGGLAGLWRVRALTLLGIAGMAWMFYLAAKRAGWPGWQAAAMALLAGTVPAVQVYAAWGTSVVNPLSAICACAAALIVGRTLDDPSRRRLRLAAAALLMLASATIYQPTAMVFWPIAALDLFRPEHIRTLWRRLAVYFIVAMVGLALAFGVFELGLSRIPQRPSIERSGITHDPVGKLSWYIHHPLVDSLNLFNLHNPTPTIAIIVGIVLVIGLLRGHPPTAWIATAAPFPLAYFLNLHHLTPVIAVAVGIVLTIGLLRGFLPTALLAAAAMFPLAYLPNLMAQESWASYRTQIGMEWLVIVLGGFALRNLLSKSLLDFTLSAGLLVAMMLAGRQVSSLIVIPQAHELATLKADLEAVDSTTNKIIMLQPSAGNIWAPYSRYDEFGRTSMQRDWVPQSAVNLVLRQTRPDLPRIPVELWPDFAGKWTDPLPPGTIVIDMRGVSYP
jgi:hypothetical protein